MGVLDIMHQTGDHYPFGINQYCPRLTGVARQGLNNEYIMDLGNPPVADADGILDGVAINATYTPGHASTPLLTSANIDSAGVLLKHKFGVELVMVASGAATQDVVITGYDYMGQFISKTKALNGTTPVSFGVAFKRIAAIAIPSGGSATVDVGWTDKLGLEYRVSRVVAEYADGVIDATGGSLTAPVLTDPATASTGDPRGLFDPTTTLDGVKHIYIQCLLNEYVNSSSNGGLHGIKHFAG